MRPPAPTSGIAADLIERQVMRILSSPEFAGSPRMARFLQFAVEEAMRGNAADLKEIVIGSAVFDRDPSYDPRVDPIVRVEARRLRSKLGAYYRTHGRYDEVIIEFPRGSYAPAFRPRSNTPATPVELPLQGVETIAVLPFRNLHPEKESEYFGDGLTEELIHVLTRVPRLRVLAWNSVSQLRDQDADIDSMRPELHVDYALRGSVRRSGEQLRITAQLIDTATGQYLFSETYDRQMRDVFAIQEQIAAAIVKALRIQLWKDPIEARRPRPECVDSWQICLMGRFHARERSAEGLRRSVICFEQAISICAESDSAWAGLADTYTLLADYEVAPAADVLPKAKAAAERALALNPLSEEAHSSLGVILCVYDWSWEESGRMFRRAIELNPGYATARHWYAVDHLAMLGRFDEARTQIEAAAQLDPLSNIIREGRAFLSTLERNYDAAIRGFEALLEIDPSFYKAYTSMGRALIQKGMYRDAIEMLTKGQSLTGEVPTLLGALGQAYALAGETTRARAVLAQLRDIAERRPVHSSCFAVVHLGLGEKDEALARLECAVEGHEPNVAGLHIHPVWDPLRAEPRFRELLKKIGF